MDVVEQEQSGRVEQLTEKRADDSVQACATERRIEVVNLGRRLHVDVERRCQERSPRHELLVDGDEAFREGGAVALSVSVQLDVEKRAQERAERMVRRR